MVALAVRWIANVARSTIQLSYRIADYDGPIRVVGSSAMPIVAAWARAEVISRSAARWSPGRRRRRNRSAYANSVRISQGRAAHELGQFRGGLIDL